MSRARRSRTADAPTRAALLDAAESLMVNEGYAAVTSRRVAAEAGVNHGLVYYYFGTMDEMFIELFRRAANRGAAGEVGGPESDQPLWRIWESIRDFSDNALMTEFIALANHRPSIRSEIQQYSERGRRALVSAIDRALARDAVGPGEVSPAALGVLMVGMSRFLQMESAFGIELGHREAVELIEGYVRSVEGNRRGA